MMEIWGNQLELPNAFGDLRTFLLVFSKVLDLDVAHLNEDLSAFLGGKKINITCKGFLDKKKIIRISIHLCCDSFNLVGTQTFHG